MKILVAIANYGENTQFAERLIEAYRSFERYQVHIVILSNIEKDFGPDIEVLVGLPDPDPWSLPFAHRPLFNERQDDYDLFIYSEDDTEVKESHIDAFLDNTELLPDNKISGFLRYEVSPEGKYYYSTIHAHYYWDPSSIIKIGDQVFARYTNDHAACFILTRHQLKKCIESGGFLIPPHKGPYDMLCSAATDPYTRCGLQKLINVTRIEESCLHHLADKYLGTIGVEKQEIDLQIKKIIELANNLETRGPIFNPSPKNQEIAHYGKAYFEDVRPEIIGVVPDGSGNILSIGCERGLTEEELIKKGNTVTAIPIDSIIAESAKLRGIKTVTSHFESALLELKGQLFDVLLLNNVVPYLENPEQIIRSFLPLLKPEGKIIISFENFDHLAHLKFRILKYKNSKRTPGPNGFKDDAMHSTTPAMVKRWIKNCDLNIVKESYFLSERDETANRLSLGLLKQKLGRRGALVAQKL